MERVRDSQADTVARSNRQEPGATTSSAGGRCCVPLRQSKLVQNARLRPAESLTPPSLRFKSIRQAEPGIFTLARRSDFHSGTR